MILTLWRALLLLFAALVAWRILTAGLAGHYADRMPGDPNALEQVMTWAPDHPLALYTKGVDILEDDSDSARALFVRAYAANPTDARPLLAIAALDAEANRSENADALIRSADRLQPANPSIQQRIALYWDQRGDTPTALQHLSKAMTADRRIRRQSFPVILQLAENPASRALLQPIVAQAPPWWPGFFSYAAARADSTEVVRGLMALRRETDGATVSEAERVAYQNRLLRDNYPAEAYLSWLNTLEREAREELGLLFNGGFELPLRNSGFGWRTRTHQQLNIRPLRTLGSKGSQSLMVRFNNYEGRFHHLAQRLFLQPGTYRLMGVARVDGLKTEGGVRWRLACLGDSREVLGQSKIFLGRSEWEDFSFDFAVPDSGCETQDLRLVSAGRHAFELDFDGLLWFDNLRIERTEGLDAAARAEALREP